MKNKVYLKQYLLRNFFFCIFFLLCFSVIEVMEYRNQVGKLNPKISDVLSIVKTKYPNVTEEELISILNSTTNSTNDFMKEYGIDIQKEAILEENHIVFQNFLYLKLLLIFILIFVLVTLFLKFNQKKDSEIDEIASYIQKISKGDYHLIIDNNTEDELSILKNEVYKIMIALKEAAEKSTEDKIQLKDSLSNISHQIKTPLTSLSIALENLEDNPHMDELSKANFLKSMKRDVSHINFLVQNILKLSKFDANVVTFFNEKVEIEKIINASLQNVSALRDLKNIDLFCEGENGTLTCDYHWQVEAITNLLKNALEHAKQKVSIFYHKSAFYFEIQIQNDGEGISSKDLPYIFKRFYHGDHILKDSTGIGLSLSKMIIEKNNGSLKVQQKNNQTTFIVRYFYS